MYNADSVIQTFRNFNGQTIIFPVFLIFLVLLVTKGTDLQKKRITILLVLSVIIIFNDISRIIIGKFTDISTYYRFIWIIPVLPVIAYVLTKIWFEVKPIWYRAAIVFLLLLLFAFHNITYLSKDTLYPVELGSKADEAVQEVCRMISENKKTEQPRVAFDTYLQLRVRSYDASILWGIKRLAYIYILETGYGQNTGKYEKEELVIQAVSSGQQGNAEELKKALRDLKIDYMVINTEFGMDEYLSQIGWYAVDMASGYTLYALN